ncbi:MAG: VOC family protein, partial [Gemmatimonadetes bacterium]
DLERRLGVRPVPGGSHPGWGTRNALVSLGAGRYLEVLAPDPEQPEPEGGRPFGLGAGDPPRLLTWAVRRRDPTAYVLRAREWSVPFGPVRDGRRVRPDGTVLSWRLALPHPPPEGGVIPFPIEWTGRAHPCEDLPEACVLERFQGLHPDPGRIAEVLVALGVSLHVEPASGAGLRARIRGPAGTLEL